MLEKISKLLNQAENAGTESEAAVFMEKAQSLATLHSVDLARARHATVQKQRTVPVQRTIHIGERGSRGLRTLTDLYLGIAAANDIEVTIASNATRVYAFGFAEDIDVSEALFASLTIQLHNFVEAFKKSNEWKKETVYRDGHYGRGPDCEWIPGGYVPVPWLTARLNFQDGFSSRISRRLALAKREREQAIIDAEKERADRPHLDEEGVPTPEFSVWFRVRHGLDLDDLDDTSSTVIEVMELLRDTGDDWTREILAEYVAALDDQSRNSGTELVLASKKQAVADFYAPAKARARGTYRGGHSGATSYGAREAGGRAADSASLGGRGSIANKREIGA